MDEAMKSAIEKSSIEPEEIDLVIVANMLGEVASDQAHLGALASSLLPHRPPALRIESACGSGGMALATACAYLESRKAETVLVIGAEKMTDVSTDLIAEGLMGAADSERDRPAGLTFPGIFGLITSRYMHEYALTREDLSLVSAVHHRNAVENPFAQFRSAITPEAVTKSSLIADPLRLLDCSPVSDGAAACILSTKHTGKFLMRASQIASDALSLSERATITSFAASKVAMSKALAEAEIELSEIDALETHDCFSTAAIINLEDLGFANAGEGIELYRSMWEGKVLPLSVNASGGLKGCGHPVGATGIKQLCDSAKTLEKRDARFAVTHNFGGACASAAIHILERI